MKTFVKLCISIIRKNKGFTAGILIMSVLSVAIAFLGANFGPSSEDTIMRFLSESCTPDAIYVTEPLPENILEAIKEIGGVRHVSPGFLYDTNIETENGSLFSVRVFRTESDPIFINTVHEEAAYDGPDPQAAISSEFAEYNQIRAGDRIRMDTPLGKKDVVVSSVISNPQTIECSKDLSQNNL